MVPDIKKILYPTDLSENARFAFKYAAVVANRFGARITVFHVLQSISANVHSRVSAIIGEESWRELQQKKQTDVLTKVKERLDQFCQEVSAELQACPFLVDEIIVKEGEPVEQILLQAEESSCDVIIMGTHGHALLADALIGSTARRVVRRSKRPVLVVRLPE